MKNNTRGSYMKKYGIPNLPIFAQGQFWIGFLIFKIILLILTILYVSCVAVLQFLPFFAVESGKTSLISTCFTYLLVFF